MEEEEEASEGEERKKKVANEGKEAVITVALGDGDVDTIHGEDVDEVGVIRDDDGGAPPCRFSKV